MDYHNGFEVQRIEHQYLKKKTRVSHDATKNKKGQGWSSTWRFLTLVKYGHDNLTTGDVEAQAREAQGCGWGTGAGWLGSGMRCPRRDYLWFYHIGFFDDIFERNMWVWCPIFQSTSERDSGFFFLLMEHLFSRIWKNHAAEKSCFKNQSLFTWRRTLMFFQLFSILPCTFDQKFSL